MAVDSKHPLYNQFREDWDTMRDTHEGERKIKEEGEKYLPATSGQKEDGFAPGQKGWEAYQAYKKRSSFPNLVRDAVEAMIGVMHHKPPVIELPAKMEGMRESANLEGESLEMLLRRINEQQLLPGRLGLLLDIPDGLPVGSMPYIAMYEANNILNWDDGQRGKPVLQNLNFVALDESEYKRTNDFEWEFKNQYRVLVLGDPLENEAEGTAVYRVGVFTEQNQSFSEEQLMEPSIGGNKLDRIPFVFVNAKDVVPTPDKPPLLGLAQLALTIYRGEADYRQALFMQGQDTLVVIGTTDTEVEFRTGANASINLPIGGDAKFIGVDSTGLSEMREALENDKSAASQKGGQLLDSVSRERESGDALKVRVAARTATLNQLALAGAFGLQTILRHAATWVGANPDEVKVTPNLDFADDELTGKTLVEYLTARSLGAPFSLESIHRIMRDRDLTEMEFEEEIKKLKAEQELELGMGPGMEEEPEEEPEPEPEE